MTGHNSDVSYDKIIFMEIMSYIWTGASFVGSRVYNKNSYSTGAVSKRADFYSKLKWGGCFLKKLWCCILHKIRF